MAKIHGNDPTGYSYDAADGLTAAIGALSGVLDTQSGPRAVQLSATMREFRGYFALAFAGNAGIASRSAVALVGALRTLTGFVDQLRSAADQEDRRRQAAREWQERQRIREENLLEGVTHGIATVLGLGDDPQPPLPQPEPRCVAEEVSVSGRSVPAPGGGSTVSSAVPADLRSFAVGIRALDAEVRDRFATFRGALADYESGCNPCWGTLNAQSLVTACDQWLTANETDTAWADAVAAQFEAAGQGAGLVTLPDTSIASALAGAGIRVTREDFAIGGYSAMGTPPTNGFADDPVNTATGNFLEPETDLPFLGAASALGFTRMYNSLDQRSGFFGPGWSSPLEIRLDLDAEGAVFRLDDGRQVQFPRLGDGWDRGTGENLWLAAEPASAFPALVGGPAELLAVRDNQGAWWAFTASGVWLAAGSGPGTAILVGRDAEGRVARLSHACGRSLKVGYLNGRVAEVAASDGRRVAYHYDDQARLIAVSDQVGTRSYRWNDHGLIDRVVSAAGVVECENVYDEQGRVIEQLTPYGRRVRFAYLAGRVTCVSNLDGSAANTWIADRRGRVVGIIDADGHRQSMSYDPSGNLVSVTERDGRTTVHGYDERGRRTRTVTAEGADLSYAYDEHDRVTTVGLASGGTTSYRYADPAARHPSLVIDPVGGQTRLSWAGGLLTEAVDPVGVRLTFDYDAYGDLVGVTNAAGNRASLTRDQAGRIVAATTPSGNRTEYRYDDAGLVVARKDADGGIWRFEHGPGGTTTATIDPYGARTEFGHGSHGELVATTDPLGRVVRREFDERGNLARIVLPDGAEWGFEHDAVARLRRLIDPAGGVWARDYDLTGQVVAATDPTLVRVDVSRSRRSGTVTVHDAFACTTVSYDAHGRPTRSEDVDGSAELVVYDASGHPVELLDADGGLTKIARDLAGRVIGITTPAGRLTRYEYDGCGRPVAAVDAAGGRTTLTYDADSRVVARTSPAGEIATIGYDELGRVIQERIPGAGVARYRYDKAGRLVFAHDARYGRRRFSYDAAGQLISATNGLGGVTRYAYDARGRLVRITDPLGGVTARSYTELDQVAASTDPLGRVTTATYDAAGRQLSWTDADGNTLEWVFDEAGLEAGVKAQGRWVSRIARDPRNRTVTFTDDSRAGSSLTQVLRFDRLGRLIERTRGEATTRWAYDADGARIGLTAPDGTTIGYQRDVLGRVTRIEHSSLGQAVFEHDADGRLIMASADGLLQRWEYDDGYLSRHTRTDRDGVSVTRIDRDVDGRIIGVSTPAGATWYGYDEACQLVSASVDGVAVSSWAYDPAGRLVAETSEAGERSFFYDRAGQLIHATDRAGHTTSYSYDGQGRRVRAVCGSQVNEYSWDERGWLAGIRETDGTGPVQVTDLWVDALGELAEADGVPIAWDTAAYAPGPISIGTTAVFRAPGGLTGLADTWDTTGWRTTRSTNDTDPWQALVHAQGRALPGGLTLTGHGEIGLAGLEWMGARPYDPLTRGFLAVDPLTPPTGAAWAGNPYSYAGNDPLHTTDPLGLAPISDADLKTYADGLQAPLVKAACAVRHWFDEYGDYLRGGAYIAVGIGLMFTGVGGPIGLALVGAGSGALISAGVSVISQKAETGTVDWNVVGGEALVGAAGGAVAGGAVGGMARGAKALGPSVRFTNTATPATRAAYTTMRNPVSRTAIANGTGNATSNTLEYHLNTPDSTATGYLQSFGAGFGTGAIGSAATNKAIGTMPNHLSEELVERTGGVLQAAGNYYLTTSEEGGDAKLLQAGVKGFLLGGVGPSTGLHAAGR